MNTRSIPEHNDDLMMAASPFSSKEQDLVNIVKTTPTPRLAIGGTSPMDVPAKVTEKNGDNPKKRRKKRKKKWTKPEGKPKRPLSAYNIFFAKERINMLGKDVPTAEQEALKKKVHCKTHGKISFAVMARTIGAKWKALVPNEKKIYEDRAREEKVRYVAKLSIWKEEENNKASKAGSDIGKMVDDGISVAAIQKRQLDLSLGISHANPGIVVMSGQGPAMSDLRVDSSAAESMNPLSQGNNGQNSNLVRLILEEENRNRYLSLLRMQNQANQSRYPQMDQANFALNGVPQGVPQRVSTPIDSISRSQPFQNFNIDTMFHDTTRMGNFQAPPPNPPMQDYNSRYFQVLEEYATILEHDRHNRMIGAFNGRNTSS